MGCCIVELRIRLIALILPFICPFFLSFWVKFVSQFSQELFKLESSNMKYIFRMSHRIVGSRPRLIALILLLLSIFPYFTFTLKICVRVFSGRFEARILELGIQMDAEL